jgi:hypothetical protein
LLPGHVLISPIANSRPIVSEGHGVDASEEWLLTDHVLNICPSPFDVAMRMFLSGIVGARGYGSLDLSPIQSHSSSCSD